MSECDACREPAQHLRPLMVLGNLRLLCQACAEAEIAERDRDEHTATQRSGGLLP